MQDNEIFVVAVMIAAVVVFAWRWVVTAVVLLALAALVYVLLDLTVAADAPLGFMT